MKINLLERIIGSGLFSGYFPFASGTAGSIIALFIYLIPGFENPFIMILVISTVTILGTKIASKFEKIYGKDPKECTIDEFVGMWISLLFVPKTILFVSAAFVIWRILDILKPFPANYYDKKNGGLSIMMDDIISGFYTLVLIHIFVYFLK